MDEQTKSEFTTLLVSCLDSMYSVALRFTRNKEDAEDLVADTSLTALANFTRLRDRAKFRSWVLKILSNLFVSTYRKKKTKPTSIPFSAFESNNEQAEKKDREFSLFDQLSSPSLLWAYNPEKIYLENLRREDILRAIDALPQQYRIVVTLCYLEDLPYQEAAKILAIPIGTVRSRLHRGRSILQKNLWHYAKEKR